MRPTRSKLAYVFCAIFIACIMVGCSSPSPAPTMPTGSSTTKQAYLLSLSDIMKRTGQNLNEFGALSKSAAQSPALVRDAEWKQGVAMKLATMKQNALEFRALSAPEEMQATDKLVKQMADHLESAATHYAEGVDELNPSKIQIAVNDFNEITRLIEEIRTAAGF